jgi:ribosomal protein S18 acetylase RimI-like enzyme
MATNKRAVAFYEAAGFYVDWLRKIADRTLGVTIAKLGPTKP